MNKQELIEKINFEIEIVKKTPYDSEIETQGFLNAMEIAKSYINQLDKTPMKECEIKIEHIKNCNCTPKCYIPICSNCHDGYISSMHNFFPNCGAKIKRGGK